MVRTGRRGEARKKSSGFAPIGEDDESKVDLQALQQFDHLHIFQDIVVFVPIDTLPYIYHPPHMMQYTSSFCQ